ncbi:hypothetical protein DXG03_009163 [Asterophora parasitica]|uniref:F-box domain-containing protein n=1 Tax=Asterophora parasitica TaxID=117018 RepID=A0A9P7G8E7_9AGAR|nr:hypothetical protein DXG03_009163 [Asterophora parasitica]
MDPTSLNLQPYSSDWHNMDLQAHQQAVDLIDIEIAGLMRTVRQLQFRKGKHEDQIKYFRGLTTLARKLPAELLACIFEECVRDGWTRTPLTASHVCPEWRIAARIPTVWSHVYVNCDAKDPCGRARFWIEKAQGSLLRVTIDVANDASRLPEIMEILSARAAQWQTFSVKSILTSHARSVLTLCNPLAPQLRELEKSIVEEFNESNLPLDGDAYEVEVNNRFLHAPHFRRLRIRRNILPSPGSFPSSVTDLSIILTQGAIPTMSSVDRALQLLAGLPALQRLSILLPYQQERVFTPSVDATRLVELPDLRTLVLVGSPDMFRILPYLATPSLSHLHLRSSLDPLSYTYEELSSNITRFIERAAPPIELLELHDIDLSPAGFTACFVASPHLKELRLHESDIPDSVIREVGASCPLLERLDLRWCGQVTGRALVELVQGRSKDSDTCYSGAHSTDSSVPGRINIVTVINCAFVKEEDILDLSRVTQCRLIMAADDYCSEYPSVLFKY